MARSSMAAAILVCLLAACPLVARGQDVPRVLQETPLGAEPMPPEKAVSDETQAAAEAMWAVFNLAVGIFLWSYLSGSNFACDMTIAWFNVGMRIIEAAAFTLFSINLLLKSPTLHLVFLATQVILHAPLLWAVAHYLRKHDLPKSVHSTLSRVCPLMAIFGLMILFSPFTRTITPERVSYIFMAAFEPPLVFQALYTIGLWCASGRETCRDPRIRVLSMALMVACLVGFTAHVRHVYMIMNPTLETMTGMILQKLVEASMIVATTFFLVKLAEIGTFHDVRNPEGSPWTTDTMPPLAEGLQRWVASPERIWSFSFLFYVIAFSISAFCLFYVIGWDYHDDPIVGFYRTIHPCVLLDYVPGTLFAQPFFDCQILTIILSMAFNFLRHVVDGSLFKILLSAAGMTVATIVGAFFNLVFTFNPREVSVLAHSVPYMMNVGVQFTFIASEAMCIFLDVGHHKYPLFTLYIIVVLFNCFFINYFMSQTLMEGYEKSSKPMSEWTPEERLTPDLSSRQLMSAVLHVVSLDALFIMWYKINPKADTAIAFDLGVTHRKVNWDGEEVDEEVEDAVASDSEPRMLAPEAANGYAANSFASNGFAANGFAPNGPAPNGFAPNGNFATRQFATGNFATGNFATGNFPPGGTTDARAMAAGPGERQPPTVQQQQQAQEVGVAYDRRPFPGHAQEVGVTYDRRFPEQGQEVGVTYDRRPFPQQTGVFYNRSITLPLISAAGWAAVGLSACVFVNSHVHAEDVENGTLEWRESIRTYPGSSVLVVCWVFAAAGVVLFVFSSVYYEYLTNEVEGLRCLTFVTGAIFVGSTLMAHAGTIPNSEEWQWYDGPRFFFAGLLVWTLKDILLLIQDWPKLRPTMAVPDLAASLATVVLLLLDIAKGTIGEVMPERVRYLATCAAVLLKCICESRNARIILGRPAIVPVGTMGGGECFFGCCPPVWLDPAPEIAYGKVP